MRCIQCDKPAVALCRTCNGGQCETHLLESLSARSTGALAHRCTHLEAFQQSAGKGRT